MKLILMFLVAFVGVVSILGGLYFLFEAWYMPIQYRGSDMNAIQATQLYTMATHSAVIAVALFVFAGLCVYSYGKIGEE